MTEAETVEELRILLGSLHGADGSFPAGDRDQHDAAFSARLGEADSVEAQAEATIPKEWDHTGRRIDRGAHVAEQIRQKARAAHNNMTVVDRERGRDWERTALTVRELRKRVSDLRAFDEDGSLTANQRARLAEAEKELRRAKAELLLGTDRLTYRQDQAIRLAERRGVAEDVDRVLDEKVEKALRLGPKPVGFGEEVELMDLEERREAVFGQSVPDRT